MTRTAALAAIRALGLSARCVDGEFRVTFKTGEARLLGTTPEDAAYYTTDAEDAVTTARVMAAEVSTRAAHIAATSRL